MARLTARPLRRCAKPRYPTKLEVWNDPELLRDPRFLHKHYNAAYPVLSLLEDVTAGNRPGGRRTGCSG